MVVDLVAAFIALVVTALEIGLHTLELGSGETKFSSTAQFLEYCHQCFLLLTVLGCQIRLESTLGLGKQIDAVVRLSSQEGTVRILGYLAETGIQHAADHVLHIVFHDIVHILLLVFRTGFVLHHHHDAGVLLLFVFFADIDSLGIIGNYLWNHLCSIGLQLDATEKALDVCLGLIHVNIAHHDDGLIVGTIPFTIISAQSLGLEVIHNLHQSDRHAMAVLTARIKGRKSTLQHALGGTGTHAPFFVNDTTLLVNLLFFEQKSVRPVFQYKQTGIECSLTLGRNIANTIDRFIDTGIGIEVAAELHTQRAGVVDDAITLEIIRAIESHVLQEMSQTALVIVLLNTSHTLCNVEVGHILRPVVFTDVISQTIVQLSHFHVFVNGNGWHLLCHDRYQIYHRE